MSRIAVGGIQTESCTFSPFTTKLADFNQWRGDDLLAQYPFLANFGGVEFLPTLLAKAIPGGPVEMATYTQLKAEFLDKLKASLPLDGVFLDMHGAMNVRGMDDAEGDWIAAVRSIVGPTCLISASYDLHGNVSERVMDNLDMLTAFRTAPHTDYMETRQRACTLLVNCLQRHIRPVKCRIPIPVLLPGERTSTEWEPGLGLYAQLPKTDQMTGILDSSLLVGYVWADEPRSTAAAIVIGTDQATVDQQAKVLAKAYWDARGEFQFGVPAASVDDCIRIALEAPESCVFISDSGDNPTAGGVGDVPYTLGRLISLNVPSAVYASIPDVAAIETCFAAGTGAQVSLSLGGKLDPVHGQPLDIQGRVITLKTLPWHQNEQNRHAVVQVGGVKVIVTERRTPFHYIANFQALDIEPLQYKIVSVKIGYLVPDLKRAAPKALLALSPGAVNQDIERLPYQRLQRPVYPLDPNMDWSAG